MENPSPGLGGVIRCESFHRLQDACFTSYDIVVGSSLEKGVLVD